jgi:hypothetical protein
MAIPHRMNAEAHVKPAAAERAESGNASDARPLTDADALAVRAIARYNVERRNAGEAPLDLKAIERFRQILADTIERYETAKRSLPDDAH